MPTRNVIYIHTHDMGRYISPYGYDIPTPNLQRLARRSTLFRQAFCCGPTCSPSRAGLLTGVSPLKSGMLGLSHRGFKLSHPEFHLGAFLRQQGFLTALCGIQHEFDSDWSHMPYEHVVRDHVSNSFEENDRAWAGAAVEFLNRRHTRPFFLSCGLFYPHRDFAAAAPLECPPAYLRPPTPLPDVPPIREDMAGYARSAYLSDQCIGRVLEAIYANGHDKDSLIIFTTDHGIAFPKMKCNLTDHGIGVSLMLAYPGNPTAGDALDAIVSHLDVFPTVCELLGLPAPAHLQGVSLTPLLVRKAASIRDEIFAEVNFHVAYEPLRCIRTDRYKLIRRYGTGQLVSSNCDTSISKSFMMEQGWRDRALAATELYDLLLDPHENTNLAGNPVVADAEEQLNARLLQWMESRHDPLLSGHVEPPPGARIECPDL